MRTYVEHHEGLEETDRGRWALVQGRRLLGTDLSQQWAERDAVRRCADQPYLIHEIGHRPR